MFRRKVVLKKRPYTYIVGCFDIFQTFFSYFVDVLYVIQNTHTFFNFYLGQNLVSLAHRT